VEAIGIADHSEENSIKVEVGSDCCCVVEGITNEVECSVSGEKRKNGLANILKKSGCIANVFRKACSVIDVGTRNQAFHYANSCKEKKVSLIGDCPAKLLCNSSTLISVPEAV
jgi:hypothetical protein